jgi:signal recognition particle receptor subunit beta
MVLFNYATRELTAKVVYYGPGLCGKTTNLEFIHKSLPEKSRGKMLSLSTQTDRTLFFDFLPLDLGSIKGMKTRVQLYTVPGQVFYDATRKLVLKGADGVVFVADSQKEMMQSNLDSWENLRQNLAENNLDLDTIPLVVQFNKRDLPDVLPVKELNRKINILKAPYFEAIALTGMGVQDTFKGIAKIVMATLSKKYGKPDEIAAAMAEQAAATERVSTSVGGKVLQSDETLDISALEEEVQELPQVEELELTEETPLSLEPVEISNSGKLEKPISAPSISKPSAPASHMKISADVESSGETELVPDETVHLSRASVTADRSAQEIPIEISVRKEGQDIKLNISIHLRIRVDES